jgi:phytoene/squalene synthetase
MAVHKYRIDHELIEAFLTSMEMDLLHEVYSPELLKTYIYGSAEVVGLMCLRVFYPDDRDKYEQLVTPARKLGEAFQKVNFLSDAHEDFNEKGRIYFRDIDFDNFTIETKKQLEAEIEKDFLDSMVGIRQLKKQVRLGIYLAYRYYFHLLKEIKKADPEEILKKRYRLSTAKKTQLLVKAYLRNTLNTF